jgi:glycosyltransferase involved in cell wall biosynthesis
VTLPSVSVALATYNGAAHLAQQLGDLASQSLLPIELIVCDDGSSDDTLAIVRAFATSAPFAVQIHPNPVRLGYRKNFIQCAGLCSGDLVAFCDQDDRWSPQKLEIIATQFQDPEIMLVFHNARVVSQTGAAVSKLHSNNEMKRWEPLTGSPWMFALGFTQVFRRSLVQFDALWAISVDQNCDGEPLAHDQWYFFLAFAIGRIVYLPDLLADYRQHGANTYGWRGFASSLLTRVPQETRDARRAIGRRLAAAESRATILQKAATGADEPLANRLQHGSEKYREFARRYQLRACLYGAHSYRNRARAFQQLLAAHAYGRDAWRIGPLGLAMDALVGLTGIGSPPSRGGE